MRKNTSQLCRSTLLCSALLISSTLLQAGELQPSNGAANDEFGFSVAVSGTIGLVGARLDDFPGPPSTTNQGAAYVFHNLHTASGTVTQNAFLLASDRASADQFGYSVSLSGNSGLIGAPFDDSPGINNHGSAYLYRNLNTATGTVTQNAKLLASEAAANDRFGYSVSLSGNTGIVGAYLDDVNSNTDQGSAYIFCNLDIVTGTVNESVKIFATNGAAGDRFGISVSLDDDRFIVGASWRNIGSNTNQGTAYFGHVRTFTTADLGNDATSTDGLSFEARENWIIGQTTSNNSVTLTSGDTGNVGRVGLVNPTAAQTIIGQNAGSNDNTLHIQSTATLTSNSVQVGTNGNSGNQLRINGTLNLASGASLTVAADNILSGAGTIQGHASNTSNTVIISGSLRPGSGDLGSGIATITRNDGNVTWNGNASLPRGCSI